MPNRPRDETKWDQIIQVSVSEDVKTSISKIAEKSGKSSSSVLRELIDKSLETDLSLESNSEKSQWLKQTESKLSDLKSLKERKLISPEEYEALRKKALGLDEPT